MSDSSRDGGTEEFASPPHQSSAARSAERTRAGTWWASICVVIAATAFLVVALVQNTAPTTVRFLGLEATVPLSAALFGAAGASALIVATVGSIRMVQLRRRGARPRVR